MCRRPEIFNETIAAIERDKGPTKTALENAHVFADSFFPEDTPDNHGQRKIRHNTLIVPNTPDDLPFRAKSNA
jgi:hypothetical protein